MRSIFISRDLDDDRLFVGLKELNCEIHAESLIQIQLLPFSIRDHEFDWYFWPVRMLPRFSHKYTGEAKIAVAEKQQLRPREIKASIRSL